MRSEKLIRRRTLTTPYRRLVSAVVMAVGLAALAASVSTATAQYTAVDLYAFPDAYSPSGAFRGQVTANTMEASALWNPNGTATDLTVAGFDQTLVAGTDGTHQFGWTRTGSLGYDANYTPVVWTGSAASATSLNTGAFRSAQLAGSGGGKFVGSLRLQAVPSRALLWNSLTAQPIDLHPTNIAGFVHSNANGTTDSQQVGHGYGFDASNSGYSHALLWTGSAGSAVDLHPTHIPGMVSSDALATDGQQQVGWGGPYLSFGHAVLWSGSAASAVNLNPAEFSASVAYGVLNGKQVGLAVNSKFQQHAMLWSGTANSAADLHLLLPDAYSESRAYSIDDAGHVFGVAFNSSEQRWHAIEWMPQAVPEPASLGLLFPLVAAALLRRRCGPRR